MKYLSYFENQDQAMSYDGQLGAPHVSYVEVEKKLLFAPYTEGVEEVKFKFENGELKLVEKAPDPTEGFVDLGLSVMWASRNLGANNPEELGEKYKWGETDEHKNGEKEFTEFPNLEEHSYSYERDAVTVSMKDNPYIKYLHYRTPTAELWQELIDNTTQEVYTNSEGRNICKYTSNINGNYIVLPLLMQTEGNNNIYYKTTTPSSLSGKESSNSSVGKIISIFSETGTTGVVPDFNDAKGEYQNNYVRGVCSYLPKTDIIQYGNSISSDSTFVLTSAHSIKITCPEDFTVYFSNTPDFTPDSSDENVVGYYTAQKHGDNYDRQISCQELSFGQSKHDYLYVRFVCNQSTQLTPSLWNVDPCISRTVLIPSGETVAVPANSNSVYRLIYEDFANYEFTASWTGQVPTSISVSSYCDFETTDPNIMKKITVRAKSSTKVTATDVDSWAASLEEDGFIYLRIVSNRLGNITFTSAKPADA
jgi:hypothetical protein